MASKNIYSKKKHITKEEILNFLKTHRKEIEEKFGVVKIGIFGSFAKNENTDSSDIDIVVEIESDNNFRSFFGLKYFIEAHLGIEVDLGIEHTVKSQLRKDINRSTIYV